MLPVYLFVLALILTLATLAYRNDWQGHFFVKVFLGYIFLLNVGIMGLLATYAHVYMGPETARQIGWEPGSPFQFEIAMANFSYGILGILAFWLRGRFWEATGIGWSVLLLGCFVGHWNQYVVNNDTAPLNIGVFVWFNDLFLPLLVLSMLFYLIFAPKTVEESRPK